MSDPLPAPLVIRLFGPLDIRVHGNPLPRLRSRKGYWLLALLTLRHGREVSRDWLAGTLWPESAGADALYSLRRSLADLRAALGPEAARVRAPSPHSLALDLEGAWADAVVFDAAVVRGDTRALEEAVAVYRGSLLEGCTEEWLLPERAARDEQYRHALVRLADGADDRRTAARWLRMALAVDPLYEGAARRLMEALGAAGEHAAAIRVYRDFCQHLRQELEAEPAPETRILFEQLQHTVRREASGGVEVDTFLVGRRRPPSRVCRTRLPEPLTGLVGREAEVREICALLTPPAGKGVGVWGYGSMGEGVSTPTHPHTHTPTQSLPPPHPHTPPRLLTLVGPGGIGKTRLAIQVGKELAAADRDGIGFVDLASLTDPALIARTAAQVLGYPEEPGESPLDALVRQLGLQRVLLILDNCEHLLEGAAQFAGALLAGCPHLQILATSRQALGITGEIVRKVPPLTLPSGGPGIGAGSAQPDDARPLEYEAVRLFLERAAAAAPGFRLGPGEGAEVARICRRLEGLPLAIELAAARVRVLSIPDIAIRLDDRFRLLTGGSRTAAPRQQTLEATLAWSYQLLSEPEKALLRRLSVFAGGWNLAAANWIAGSPLQIAPQSVMETPQIDVLDLLTQLVDKSLVYRVGETASGSRYQMLETVREYARGRLLDAGEAGCVQERHAVCFLQLAERGRAESQGPGAGAWLDRLDREHDNLRAALQWYTSRGEALSVLRMTASLWRFWERRGHWSEGRRHLDRALALGGSLPDEPALIAEARFGAGVLARRQSDYDAAGEHYARSLALLDRQAGDPRAGDLQHEWGLVALARGAYVEARSRYEDSLSIAREAGDDRRIAALYNELGEVLRHLGDRDGARRYYEQCLTLSRALDNPYAVAGTLANLGNLALETGDYSMARERSEESLALLRQFGDPWGIALVLNNLGLIATLQDDPARAEVYYRESLALRRDLDDAWGVACSLDGLGGAAVSCVPGPAGARRAALFGAAEDLRERIGAVIDPTDGAVRARALEAARRLLDGESWQDAWEKGRGLGLDDAVRLGLESQ